MPESSSLPAVIKTPEDAYLFFSVAAKGQVDMQEFMTAVGKECTQGACDIDEAARRMTRWYGEALREPEKFKAPRIAVLSLRASRCWSVFLAVEHWQEEVARTKLEGETP